MGCISRRSGRAQEARIGLLLHKEFREVVRLGVDIHDIVSGSADADGVDLYDGQYSGKRLWPG
jgi:hypothetical protein